MTDPSGAPTAPGGRTLVVACGALARELLPTNGHAGADHVLIGRQGGIERDFSALRGELAKALAKVAPRAPA